MLITFRTNNQGSVIMFAHDAQKMMALLGLPGNGSIAPTQLPELMRQLKEAMAADKSQNPIVWPEASDNEEDKDIPPVVQFSQRAAPMLQLMERCLKTGETIRW